MLLEHFHSFMRHIVRDLSSTQTPQMHGSSMFKLVQWEALKVIACNIKSQSRENHNERKVFLCCSVQFSGDKEKSNKTFKCEKKIFKRRKNIKVDKAEKYFQIIFEIEFLRSLWSRTTPRMIFNIEWAFLRPLNVLEAKSFAHCWAVN